MELYSSNENYKLYHGNMLDMLDVIDKESIDAVLTDPPYELNFMSKSWDNSGIAFQKETWQKCYEVLKPGGYLLAFGGSRTFHRIACAIEDAGFEIRDTIMWLYGSGFPKSMDISKQIDKKGGNDYSKQFAKDLKHARESRNLTMKYCDDKYCNSSTNWSWYEGRKDGCRVPDYNTYLEIIKEFPELEKYRELIKEAEREVIGKGKAAFKTANAAFGGKGWGTLCNDYDITAPSTELAKQWQGWGTALKPSFEPIIVARKPFKGSLVDNVIEYGVGGINIDECRVENNGEKIAVAKDFQDTNYSSQFGNENFRFKQVNTELKEQGRFPANTILTYDETDFDEVCGGFPDTKSQYRNVKPSEILNKKDTVFETSGYKDRLEGGFNDSGSASRYFYTAKASKKDRDCNGIIKNIHPTCKPCDLMQYLVRLVSPEGATILDPFNGSGSTGKAVMYENKERNKNYKYIGIELTEEYLPISKARIEYLVDVDTKEEKKDIPEGQLSIFDFGNEEL